MKTLHGNDYFDLELFAREMMHLGWNPENHTYYNLNRKEVLHSCDFSNPEYSEFILSANNNGIELRYIDEFNDSDILLAIKNKKHDTCIMEVERLIH